MFENPFIAGAIPGIPVSLLCLGYVLVRRDEVVRRDLAGRPRSAPRRELRPGGRKRLA